METRILIPGQLSAVIVNSAPKTKSVKQKFKKRNSRKSTEEKPSSSGIVAFALEEDSENEEQTLPLDFSSSESISSAASSTSSSAIFSSDSNDGRISSLSSLHSNSNSEKYDSESEQVVSSRRKVKNKPVKDFQKKKSHQDGVKIVAKEKISCGTTLDPNDGDVQIISIKGIESLALDDIRLAFGCFDRLAIDPQNGSKIRLCNWIRFARRTYNSFDTRVNMVGKFLDGSPVLEFTKEIFRDEELVVFFDVGSLHQAVSREPGTNFRLTRNEDSGAEAPLDLSKSPSPPKSKIVISHSPKSSDEDSPQNFPPVLPDRLTSHHSNPFSVRNVLGMKLFQPHLYSPPNASSSLSSSTLSSTNPASLSSPTNTNSTLNSPNCLPPTQLSLLGSGNLGAGAPGLLRPILRTRGRERSLLPCEVCGKAFDRPSLLKRHMRTHTGEKPHICDVCNKGFSTSSSLNTHRRIHSGEKPHQCPMCGKRFTASSNLYYHKMTHNKEKPHKCKCGKSFPTPGDLKSHQYVHSGSWPYNCPICHRGFSKQTNLRNHLLLHSGTGEKPHLCQICGKRFALACNLRAHSRTHEEDPVTSCSSCKRTFLTSLNMLVNGQCRSCLLELQTSTSNNSRIPPVPQKNSEAVVKIEQRQPELMIPPQPAMLHGFHHHPGGLFHESLGFGNGTTAPNPFLEQLVEWNWRFAKETAGNLGLMQQKLLESQMLAAQLMSVSNSPGISDLLRFRPPGLPHTGEFGGMEISGLNKFIP